MIDMFYPEVPLGDTNNKTDICRYFTASASKRGQQQQKFCKFNVLHHQQNLRHIPATDHGHPRRAEKTATATETNESRAVFNFNVNFNFLHHHYHDLRTRLDLRHLPPIQFIRLTDCGRFCFGFAMGLVLVFLRRG